MSGSVRYGLARGVFSNEAGLGSLAVLHGAAEDTTPEQQGMWAMFEVFFDTMVVCTLTADSGVRFHGGLRVRNHCGLVLSGNAELCLFSGQTKYIRRNPPAVRSALSAVCICREHLPSGCSLGSGGYLEWSHGISQPCGPSVDGQGGTGFL